MDKKVTPCNSVISVFPITCIADHVTEGPQMLHNEVITCLRFTLLKVHYFYYPQDPEVVMAPLPMFHRPLSMDSRDTSISGGSSGKEQKHNKPCLLSIKHWKEMLFKH